MYINTIQLKTNKKKKPSEERKTYEVIPQHFLLDAIIYLGIQIFIFVLLPSGETNAAIERLPNN